MPAHRDSPIDLIVLDVGVPPTTGFEVLKELRGHRRDVSRTLRGEYGSRATRDDPADNNSSVMHVAGIAEFASQRIFERF